MSLFVSDIVYLGIKSCIFVTRIVGISSYNTIAYFNGYEMMEFFPKTTEQLLLEEVRNLKKELKSLKNENIHIRSQPLDYQEIVIEEIEEPEQLLITN